MTTFLGPIGSLIPVKCASTLTSSGGREVTFTRTLGKQKAFLGQVRAREWNVDIGLAKPSELSGLRWLADYSTGSLVWYSPDAVVGNILPPGQAVMEPGTHQGLDGPLVEVEPGLHLKSVFSDSFDHPGIQRGASGYDPAPVPVGALVTCSVWMRGNTLGGRQMLRVQWHDLDGGTLGSVDTDFVVPSGWARRLVTVEVPPGAAQVRMMPYATQVAGPTITLTDKVMPYAPGQGAKRVVAHDLARAVIRATEGQQYQSLSFTVSEVG